MPLVLDFHEAMPVFFPTRFPRAASPVARRALGVQERLSIRAASHVIIVNEALRDRLVGLGVRSDKITVVPNSPSLARFDPASVADRPFMADGALRLVYAGALTPIYELDVAIDAVARLARAAFRAWTSASTSTAAATRAGAARARSRRPASTNASSFHGRIPLEDVPAALAAADIGLAPTRRDAFTDFSLSTKIFEYGGDGRAGRRDAPAARRAHVRRGHRRGPTSRAIRTTWPGRSCDLVDDPVGRAERVRPDRGARSASSPGSARCGRYVALVEALARGRAILTLG